VAMRMDRQAIANDHAEPVIQDRVFLTAGVTLPQIAAPASEIRRTMPQFAKLPIPLAGCCPPQNVQTGISQVQES